MYKPIRAYVRFITRFNTIIGKASLYLVFAMMGILLYESITRTFFDSPNIWTMEMAQFTMAAYYMLGGAFSLIMRSHVRMDVLYSRWMTREKAKVDIFTSFFLVFYLVILLYGSISSTMYSIEYGQTNYTAWAPPMSPIKVIMVIGIFLMLLQAVARFFEDIATARGEEL